MASSLMSSFTLHKPPLLTTPFLPTTTTLALPTTATTTATSYSPLTVKAMKSMQGKVVCATNNKTVSVEVTRLAPHPKYKRRVRMKKKFQAHDEDNLFKVGDLVQLQKCRPISKTKAFIAVPPLARRNSHDGSGSAGVGIPLQSEVEVEGEDEVGV
ncbi:hypothetical protein vseg_018392 [Gypsophila vaccaria]